MISDEKILMSTQLKGCVTWLSIAFSNWFSKGKLNLEIRICEITCLTYLRICLHLYSRARCACVLTCLACFCAYIPTSSQDWCDCVLACSREWVLGVLAYLFGSLACLLVLCPYVLTSKTTCLLCSNVLRAYEFVCFLSSFALMILHLKSSIPKVPI